MKLIDFLHLSYEEDGEKFLNSNINYALENLEYRSEGNPLLHDNCREGIQHNGVVPRNKPLSGEEVLDSGIYSLTTFGHDGREILSKHQTINAAEKFKIEWGIEDNPYVHNQQARKPPNSFVWWNCSFFIF